MEKRQWQAIESWMTTLRNQVQVEELVHYLEQLTTDKRFKEDLGQYKTQDFVSLYDYLKRERSGFSYLCSALKECQQEFLVTELQKTVDAIPDIDAASALSVTPSRVEIFGSLVDCLTKKTCSYSITGLRGVGKSHFLEQLKAHLTEHCYFFTHTIDVFATPLVLQQMQWERLQNKIVLVQRAMRKYHLICLDNFRPEEGVYADYQGEFVQRVVQGCKELALSLVVTSSKVVPGTESIVLQWLPREELSPSRHPMVKGSSAEVQKEIPPYCSPLFAFLINLLFLVKGRHKFTTNIRSINLDKQNDENEERKCRIIFHTILAAQKPERMQLLSALYAMPPCAEVHLSTLLLVLHGSNAHCTEAAVEAVEEHLRQLVFWGLIQKLPDGRYSVRDLNFYLFFKGWVRNPLASSLNNLLHDPRKMYYKYYKRGVVHYLDRTIEFLKKASSLHEFSEEEQSSWKRDIPCVAFALDPALLDKEVEDAINRKEKLSKEFYRKRLQIIEKAGTVCIDLPAQVIMLAISRILENFEAYHSRYAEKEDKAKLLCRLTEMSIETCCDTADVRVRLFSAVKEVYRLVAETGGEAIRTKYYLRLFGPLAEIYKAEGNYDTAAKCLRQCLKLPFDNKTIKWSFKKRLSDILTLQASQAPPQPMVSEAGTSSDTFSLDLDANNISPIDKIRSHLEVSDSYYIQGELEKAYNFYFELYRRFHSLYVCVKEQENALVNMGHLKLQKHPKLARCHVEDAYRFYDEAHVHYIRRTGRESVLLKLYSLATLLILGKLRAARRILNGFRNAQEHSRAQFCILLSSNDNKSLWREFSRAEKRIFSNRLPAARVNFTMLEPVNYSIKKQKILSYDDTRFYSFPSEKDPVDLASANLFSEAELQMSFFIQMHTTKI